MLHRREAFFYGLPVTLDFTVDNKGLSGRTASRGRIMVAAIIPAMKLAASSMMTRA
jgi:hypothetical protein